ncbi:DsbA family protein [Gordonia sp. (in: high G+C Gram-positive bacteria)]|uniref:DsbA family protein n=1 Tax=Gordonia sp. (in: high G+C Gram-positive bacteria) TaxID=84139 RepID=UPI0039E618AE
MSKRFWLIAAGIVALLAVAVSIVDGRAGDDRAPETAAPPSAAAKGKVGPLGDLARRTPGDPRAIGQVDAPVVMVVLSDFRCPYCAEYEKTVQPKLVRKYVDPGVLRIEWRDDPVFGEQSELAARAGWAAAAQGRFWQFAEAVYRDVPETGHPDLPIDVLVDRAKTAGVKDLKRFRGEALGDTYAAKVKQDQEPVRTFGISGTPTFVVNGEPMIGVQPMDVFERLVDDAAGPR